MKKMIFALFLAAALSACNLPALTPPTVMPVNTPEPTSTPWAPTIEILKLSARLDSMFQKSTKTTAFSGSVLIAQNGHVILSEGYGFADRQEKIPNTAQTKFRIASLTKQFTAMGIMMLQEQGKLNVHDNICLYLTGCPDDWKPVTLHHLLTHTSGIPEAFDAHDIGEVSPSLSLEQVIADVKLKPLDFQPGERFSYNNTGYILLGKIIETVSGQTYEDFLYKNIFEPLEMSSTGYDHGQDDLAVGYKDQHIAGPINMRVVFSAGALYSTVEDLYRWDQALYTDKLLPRNVSDIMFMKYVQVPNSGGWDYGYGWITSPDGQQRIIAHYGGINGFASVIKRFPDDQTTIIILANQQSANLDNMSKSVTSKLFED